MVAAIRLTRQYVDAVGPGDGKTRVTRQYIDALYGAAGKTRVSQQYVEILGSAVESVTYNESVTSTLAFNQTLVAGFDRVGSVTSTLAFTSNPEASHVHFVGSTLSLQGAASAVRDIPKSITDHLGLTQETVWIGPHYIDVMHFLEFAEIPYGHLAVINVSVNDTLVFTQKMGRTIYASVSHQLNLQVVGIKRNKVDHTLAFTQTINAGKSKQVTSNLGIVPILHVQGLFHRHVIHDLGLVHSGAFESLVGPCQRKQYEPQVGFTTDTTVLLPSATPPTLSDATLTLTFPYVSPTNTLVLRNSEFGNKDTLNFNRINRTTRGGALVVFADSEWPKTQTLAVTLNSLTPAQADDLLTFFDQSLGLEVGLLDHEGRLWRGIITNPDSPIANPGRDDYSASFEFEGVLC